MARKGDGIYKRGKVWYLDAWIGGKRCMANLGKNISRAVALELASIERAKFLRGEAGIREGKRKDLLFETAKEQFLAAAEGRNRPHTLRGYKQHLAQLAETFAGKQLSEISPFLIEKHRQRRIADGAPVGFNRELGTLRTLFNWCIDKAKYNGPNPTRKIKRLRESAGRERFLEPEEEKRLLGACSEPLRTIVLCGIYASLRIPSEVLSLKWASVDTRRGFLTVEGAFAKNGQTETLPLNPELRAALEALKAKSKSEYVFTKPDGQPFRSIQNIFRTAVKRAGLNAVSPHVCRHTFASRLAERGISLRTIQKLGRWADIRMVQRYANVSERQMREAVEQLSQGEADEVKPAEIASRMKTPVRYTKDSVSA